MPSRPGPDGVASEFELRRQHIHRLHAVGLAGIGIEMRQLGRAAGAVPVAAACHAVDTAAP